MLNFIDKQMDILDVPYEFGEWEWDGESPVKYPYFVGEFPSPETIDTEDGHRERTLIISGFHRGKAYTLEEIRQRIEAHFDPIGGLRGETEDGSAIAVFYNGAHFPPTGEMALKKIEIQLQIQLWKGV